MLGFIANKLPQWHAAAAARVLGMEAKAGTGGGDVAAGAAAAGKSVVLITGAASGIGAALAAELAARRESRSMQQLCLLLHSRQSKDALEAVADAARQSGARVETLLGDLSAAGSAAAAVEEAVRHFGQLDAIISNAGGADSTPLEDTDAAKLNLAFGTMAQAFVMLAQAAVPHLRRSACPRVVVVSSFITHRYAVGRSKGFVASAGAKAALESYMRSLASLLAPDGIPVNGVAPGHIEKDKMVGTPGGQVRRDSVADVVPMGRIGVPSDVVGPIMFLMSPSAGYMTGQMLHVDGGIANL